MVIHYASKGRHMYMKRNFFIILLMILVALNVVSCGLSLKSAPTPSPTAHPGKAIISGRCTGCHELNRITSAAFDRQGWQLTVDRMVLAGAQLSEEQEEL